MNDIYLDTDTTNINRLIGCGLPCWTRQLDTKLGLATHQISHDLVATSRYSVLGCCFLSLW